MIKSDAPGPEASGTPGVDPLIGRTLNGRFSITEPIGVGGMGKVYRAMQAPLDRVVALKVLNPSFPSTRDPGFQQRFLREASLTSKLRHPNTVTVIDYGQTDDGIFYIAMEYLEGRTLAQVLAQTGPLPWSRVIAIVQQVCRSLREAHAMGIVHRDLKPANIMLLNEADQDLVKVLDFGLVKSIGPGAEGENAPLSPEITQSGTFLGSPQYMAPEQARNVADVRSDIYSLGVVMYQMLQGRPPFVARDHLELIFSHCKEPPPPFNSLRPHIPVPHDIEAVVMRCLEKDPARRFQSMDEMLEAMRTANMAAGGHSGLFKRPGGGTTGPHASPLFASAGAPDTNASTLALDISVEVPEAVAKARRRRLMGMGALAVGAVVVGLTATVLLLKSRDAAVPAPVTETVAVAPAPATPPPATPEPAQAAPQQVRFRLMSEPTGARVYYQGKERGTTPFVLEIPAGGDGTVTAELTFALEGYQTEKVITGGSGDVVLSQKLQKRRGGSGGGSSKVEFASARGTDSLEPATAMLDPAESLVPSSPPPGKASASPGKASAADDGADSGGKLTVPGLPAGVLAAANSNMPMPYGQGMSRPEQLEGKEITYTREALAAKVQGMMVVKCTITRQGRVENCRTIKPVPHMETAVLDALRSRVYKPILYKGQPVAVDYVFNIKLQLPRR
ncbi:TonB family protein [Hyalangium gracile]|uniref:TonB family protein n=1 Tax=Hyalangium gracile TaxID=394092 RepID=UPI001CCE5666|nr:TonB family protein [Hyalangium gracile]